MIPKGLDKESNRGALVKVMIRGAPLSAGRMRAPYSRATRAVAISGVMVHDQNSAQAEVSPAPDPGVGRIACVQ